MKRFVAIFLFAILLTSVAIADYFDSELYADTIIQMLEEKNFEVADLIRIKEKAEQLAQKKQESNSIDPEYLGVWNEKYFVDSFGDPTDKKYILGLFDGKFSNSATTNSSLTVRMLISLNGNIPYIGLELYEYGDYKVKNTGSDATEYYFKVKDEDGEIHQFIYSMSKERMYFKDKKLRNWESDEQKVIDLLKTKKTLKFNFYDNNKFYSSTYQFNIDDTTGFENALRWLSE